MISKNSLYVSSIDSKANEIAKKYGIGIEIADYCVTENLDDRSKTDLKTVERFKITSNIIMHGPYTELFPCSIDLRVRDICKQRFLQTLEVAKSFGIKKIILHGNYIPKVYFPVWYINESVKFFKDFMDFVPNDVTICLENVMEEDPSYLIDIVNNVNDKRLRLCLDLGHINVSNSKYDCLYWIEKSKGLVSHYHLHNNNKINDEHKNIGSGTIDYKKVLEIINREDVTYTIENIDDAYESIKYLIDNKYLID